MTKRTDPTNRQRRYAAKHDKGAETFPTTWGAAPMTTDDDEIEREIARLVNASTERIIAECREAGCPVLDEAALLRVELSRLTADIIQKRRASRNKPRIIKSRNGG
jgi:hypothetical protein